MVNAGFTGAGSLSQAKIYQLECSAQVALYSEKSHCTFTNHYLASQHLYQLGVTDVKATLLSEAYILSGIVKLSETEKDYCTGIVLALLEIHLHHFYSHPVVPLTKLKVSMLLLFQ